jgi:N-acetyl-gamma-glutamyl-phosphate reductase
LTPQVDFGQAQADAILNEAYADETFVRVLPHGQTPSLAAVRGSNFCDVAAVVDARTGTLLLLSAIDNLVKGSGGQAVQCANLMLDLPESTGLLEAPLIP